MNSTVFFVEDDDDARTSLTRSLERAGYRVLAASGTDAALALVSPVLFIDVVVTDVFLGAEPLGGLRLLRELKTRGVEAPVVLITAFAAIDSVKLALNEGATFLLEKPFRAAQLLEVVGRIVSAPPARLTYSVDRALTRVGLTEKEQAIARYVLKGLTSNEIARLESNSDKTIRQHITRIYAKCGVSSRAEFFHYVFPW
jgi:DNA-binding NarL/FixJ family response regulator